MKDVDLTYTQDSLFTRFFPESKIGESAWNEIAKYHGGVANIPNNQSKSTISQLRRAGYVVVKATKVANEIFQRTGIIVAIEAVASINQ